MKPGPLVEKLFTACAAVNGALERSVVVHNGAGARCGDESGGDDGQSGLLRVVPDFEKVWHGILLAWVEDVAQSTSGVMAVAEQAYDAFGPQSTNRTVVATEQPTSLLHW